MQRWHGHHRFDRISALVWDGAGHGSGYGGRSYWVDMTNGSASYSGTSPDVPLATIDAALALCTAGNDDYIFVLDCWQEGATITVDKTTVHIIGLGNPYATWACLNVATDLDVFTLSSLCNYSEIAGFCLGGGSTKAGIDLGNAVSQWIHHNTFGHSGAGDTPLYGICADQANPADALIEDNTFMGDRANAKGTITSNGIYQNQGGAGAGFLSSVIRNNTFMGLTGATVAGAITLLGAGGVKILDNTFFTEDVANGDAINLLSTFAVHGCIIMGNRVANGMLSNAYSFNPYRDLNANTLNAWGLNYMGNQMVEPVGV